MTINCFVCKAFTSLTDNIITITINTEDNLLTIYCTSQTTRNHKLFAAANLDGNHFLADMTAQYLLRVSCLLLSIFQTSSFQIFQTARSLCGTRNSYLQMVAYPTKIRNVVTKMTESTQKALQKMNSR